MNPYEHLESEKTRIENKSRFLIDNRQNLCEHGGLNTMIAQKVRYIPGKVYNSMKKTFIKNWESKSVLGFNSSGEIPNFNNYDISDSNMRCKMCIKELWHDISGKVDILKELHLLVRFLNKPDTCPRENTFGVCKTFRTKLTDYFFTIIDLGTTSFGNESLFNQQKYNSLLIKKFGPMYIDFDEYPHCSSRNSEILKKC